MVKKHLGVKFIFLIVGILMSIVFCINVNRPNKFVSAVEIDRCEEFLELSREMIKDDNYETISLPINATAQDLMSAFGIRLMACSDAESERLSYEDVISVCDDFGYTVGIRNGQYKIYPKFQLKRLIVSGEVSKTYGASYVLSDSDLTYLNYRTEEETEFAYNELIKNKNLEVMIDSLIWASDYVVEESNLKAMAIESYNSWGADEMGINNIRNKINSMNIPDSKQVSVVVLDSGIYKEHEMFQDRLIYNNGNLVGAYATTSSISDSLGHGTHVAGTVADLTPENVKIIPIKVLNNEGKGSNSSLIWGLNYILDNLQSYNVVCANMSLGGSSLSNGVLEEINDKFEDLLNKNIIPIVAAGNDKLNLDNGNNQYYWPANCENAITVSWLNQDASGNLSINKGTANYNPTTQSSGNWSWGDGGSNYGSCVDIAAPGTFIKSAGITSKTSYSMLSGTSMATPHVSSGVALMCLMYEDLTAEEITYKLTKDFVLDLGNKGKDVYYGYGLMCFKSIVDQEVEEDKNIIYRVEDVETTYNGQCQNIKITVTEPSEYSIVYSLTENGTYYENVASSPLKSKFKNVTDGDMMVYFKIIPTSTDYAQCQGSAKLKINKANISVKINNASSVYGDDLSSISYEVQGLVGDDTVQDLNLVADIECSKYSNVGEYNISAVCKNGNYNATFTNALYIIEPKVVFIFIQDYSFEYGNSPNVEDIKFTTTALVGFDTVLNLNLSFSIKDNVDCLNIGRYDNAIEYQWNNQNYSVLGDYADCIVSKRNIKISTSQSSIYGNQHVLDDNNYNIISGEVLQGDELQVTLSFDEDLDEEANAGTYLNNIVATSLNSNYNVEMQSSVYTINKRYLKIEIKEQELNRFGKLQLNSDDYIVLQGDLVDGDELKFETKTDAKWYSWFGEYNLSAQAVNDNYDVEVVSAKVELKVSSVDYIIILSFVGFLIVVILSIVVVIIRRKKRARNYQFTYDNLNIRW